MKVKERLIVGKKMRFFYNQQANDLQQGNMFYVLGFQLPVAVKFRKQAVKNIFLIYFDTQRSLEKHKNKRETKEATRTELQLDQTATQNHMFQIFLILPVKI